MGIPYDSSLTKIFTGYFILNPKKQQSTNSPMLYTWSSTSGLVQAKLYFSSQEPLSLNNILIHHSSIFDGITFCISKFENTYKLLIVFYICTGSTGTPVETQQHLLFIMVDYPLSVARPPSLPTAACFTNTGIKDVPMNEMTTKNG